MSAAASMSIAVAATLPAVEIVDSKLSPIPPANLLAAIEPASCAFETPRALIVTSPEDVAKSLLLNVATPLIAAVASTPDIVTVSEA